MDFDVTDQIAIAYFAFVKYARKNVSTRRQCISYSWISRKRDTVIDFGIPMKRVCLIKMCLNETCSKTGIGKHLSSHPSLLTVRIKEDEKDGLVLMKFAVSNLYERSYRRLNIHIKRQLNCNCT